MSSKWLQNKYDFKCHSCSKPLEASRRNRTRRLACARKDAAAEKQRRLLKKLLV